MQVTVAARRIRAGEEICHVYQGHFGDTGRDRRRAVLRKEFHFWCGCHACEQDYPQARNLPGKFTDDEEFAERVGVDEAKKLDSEMDRLKDRIRHATAKRDSDAIFTTYCQMMSLAGESGLRPPHRMFVTGRAAIIDQLWLRAAGRAAGVRKGALFVMGTYE